MITLKGWLGESNTRNGVEYRWLYYPCPVHHTHNDCIPVTDGPSVNILYDDRPFPIWHKQMVDGKLVVSPSINQSACKYHDFYQFELVSEGEIGTETF